jgi:hypothetical protein
MTALNSEGLEKAVAQAIFDPGATEGYKGDRTLTEWQVQAVMRAITSHTPALPPVDGLEVVMEKICHKEQIGIWANEITSALALSDFLREEWTFDDSVDLEKEIAAQLRDIIKSAITHPGLDLVASLSQASSVIAGLKEENEKTNLGWEQTSTQLGAALSRISSLEEQNKRLREALNQSRLAFSGYVSPRSAIDMIDTLGDHNG